MRQCGNSCRRSGIVNVADQESSTWVLVTNNEAFLADSTVRSASIEFEVDLILWTDGYSNLFDVLNY